MSRVGTVNSSGGAAAAPHSSPSYPLPAGPRRSRRPPLCAAITKEESNTFLLWSPDLNGADVTDIFLVLPTQLLRVSFAAAEPCQVDLAWLQVGVPWGRGWPGGWLSKKATSLRTTLLLSVTRNGFINLKKE